jgi:hypothetical protein
LNACAVIDAKIQDSRLDPYVSLFREEAIEERRLRALRDAGLPE